MSIEIAPNTSSKDPVEDTNLQKRCDSEGYLTQLEQKLLSMSVEELKKYVDVSLFESEEEGLMVIESMKTGVRNTMRVSKKRRRKCILEVRKVMENVNNETIIYKMRDLNTSHAIILFLSDPDNLEEVRKRIIKDNEPNEEEVAPPPKYDLETRPTRRKKKKKPPQKKKKKNKKYEDDSDFSISESDADEELEGESEEEEEEEEEEVPPPPETPKKKSKNYNLDDDYVYQSEEEIEPQRSGKKRKRTRKRKKNKRRRKGNKGLRYNDLDFEDQEDWSEARKKAYAKKDTNPNEFYYRFLDSDEEQSIGAFSKREKKIFMEHVDELELPYRDDRNWGLFSKGIKEKGLTGRVGYQFANFYRAMVAEEEISDDHYEWVEDKHGEEKLRMTRRVLYGRRDKRQRSSGGGGRGGRRRYVSNVNHYEKKYANLKIDYVPSYSLGGDGYQNPIPKVRDPITNELMKRPMVSRDGYVLDKDTWAGQKNCPYTKKRHNRRALKLLTEENVIQLFLGTFEKGYHPIRVFDVSEYPEELQEEFKKRGDE